jgi:ammonia channel protein AmtB
MAQKGDAEMIGKWVDSLESQSEARREEIHKASGGRWLVVAGVLVVGWVLTLPLGWLLQTPSNAESWRPHAFIFLLFLAPMLAGASGATVRMFLPNASTPNFKSIFLGLAAGAISGVLLLASHLVAKTDPHNFVILLTAVAAGFIAGLTFDAVFKKLESVDVLQSDVLKKARK